MAKVEIKAERIPLPVEYRTERTVVLTMTEQEAVTLQTILHKIAGPPAGRRGDADHMRIALSDAGVRQKLEASGSITFGYESVGAAGPVVPPPGQYFRGY